HGRRGHAHPRRAHGGHPQRCEGPAPRRRHRNDPTRKVRRPADHRRRPRHRHPPPGPGADGLRPPWRAGLVRRPHPASRTLPATRYRRVTTHRGVFMTQETTAPARSARLGKSSLGVADLVFFVVAAAAPLTVVAGVVPLAIRTGGMSAAYGYLIPGAILILFAIGF